MGIYEEERKRKANLLAAACGWIMCAIEEADGQRILEPLRCEAGSQLLDALGLELVALGVAKKGENLAEVVKRLLGPPAVEPAAAPPLPLRSNGRL